jgi:hypothetical protein
VRWSEILSVELVLLKVLSTFSATKPTTLCWILEPNAADYRSHC